MTITCPKCGIYTIDVIITEDNLVFIFCPICGDIFAWEK